MAGRNEPYEFTTVRTMRAVKSHLRDGWEVVESSGKQNWVWGSDYQAILRRPNPKYRPPEMEQGQSRLPEPERKEGRPAADDDRWRRVNFDAWGNDDDADPWYRRVPWWGWAIAVAVVVGLIGALLNPGDSKPAEADTPAISTDTGGTPTKSELVTRHGLTVFAAQAACDVRADGEFPYGVKMHWLTGNLAEELQGDKWFLKVTATVTNAFGAEQDGVNVECFVSGTDTNPVVSEFNAY